MRKQALAQLLAAAGHDAGGTLRYSDHVRGQGPAFFEQACSLGLEGIISKRADAPYRSGRGKRWLKVKCGTQHDEFVVGGYTPPAGARSGFGALLLGMVEIALSTMPRILSDSSNRCCPAAVRTSLFGNLLNSSTPRSSSSRRMQKDIAEVVR